MKTSNDHTLDKFLTDIGSANKILKITLGMLIELKFLLFSEHRVVKGGVYH